MTKGKESTLDKLIGLVKVKKKHHYRLFMVKNGVENLVEEREIDGDRDEETRVIFEDYSNRKDNNGIN